MNNERKIYDKQEYYNAVAALTVFKLNYRIGFYTVSLDHSVWVNVLRLVEASAMSKINEFI